MIEIRRDDDGELCGYVEQRDAGWWSLTVFGGELGVHDSEDEATRAVVADGLRSLADHWLLSGPDTDDELVCIQSASPGSVTVALGYYSMPGVPTRTLTREELRSGPWTLRPAS